MSLNEGLEVQFHASFCAKRFDFPFIDKTSLCNRYKMANLSIKIAWHIKTMIFGPLYLINPVELSSRYSGSDFRVVSDLRKVNDCQVYALRLSNS